MESYTGKPVIFILSKGSICSYLLNGIRFVTQDSIIF